MPENNQNSHPVIPLALQAGMPSNILEAIRPYQAFYNSVMLQLESALALSRPGTTSNPHINTLTEMAERTRREAEAIIGIQREIRGRIHEYPLTPNEAFAIGVDPYRRDSEGVFSVLHRRADGSIQEVHSEAIPSQHQELTRERIEEVFRELFEGRPRDRQIRLYASEGAIRAYEEAIQQQVERRFADELEHAMWYGRPTTEPRKTRRDKKVNESPYWEYEPFD